MSKSRNKTEKFTTKEFVQKFGYITGGKKKQKYGNKKVEYDGKNFDSTKEKNRYVELKLLKRAGEIKDFKWQYPMKFEIDGELIFTYILDFLIIENIGTKVYEDVKGFDKKTGKYITTPLFNLKKKIIEKVYDVKIEMK